MLSKEKPASAHGERRSEDVGVITGNQPGDFYTNQKDSGSPAEYEDQHVACPSHTTERRLMTKVDLRLIPFLVLLYLLAFLDRINIGNARSFHLIEDLQLTGVQYNTALTVFFVPYVLFEIPSNILLKRFSPRIWLSLCGLGFGSVTVFMGFSQNFAGLVVCRFFLGLFECGMFPGCFYLLGMWYTRAESQKRYTFFFSSTSLAGAFGGLLAGAIGKMDGVNNWHGWRWIFILEGLVTVVVCFIFLFTFPTFPEEAKWLREDERAYIKARLAADVGHNAADRKVSFRDVLSVLKDYKVILGGFMYFGLIVPAYSYAFFAPAIIGTYNYSAIQTQLYSVPPWVVAFGFGMLMATISDYARHRFLFVVGCMCLSVTGLIILLIEHDRTSVKYAALFLTCAGTYSAMPIIVCWYNMNLGGHHRRAIGVAWQIGFGNIGGIISTYSFVATDAPFYTKGYAISLAFVGISAISCCAYAALVTWDNRQREKHVQTVDLSDHEKSELGDLNPNFRYML